MHNHHQQLPIHNSKYAPSKKIDSKARKAELEHFLEFYDHLCEHYEVVNPEEKSRGIGRYCTSKVARRIESYPSFTQGDYPQLIDDILYFAEKEEDIIDLAKVRPFTKEWRKWPVDFLQSFKRDHRKFFELIGPAIGKGTLDQKEYNKYFWEGIHRDLREKIENRLLVRNPQLDYSVPFPMADVVKAVQAIFN